MSRWEGRFEDRPIRTGISFGSAVSVGLVLVGCVGGTAMFVANLASQPARVVSKTFDADNMIYNYEWFRQQYADIQAMDGKLSAATDTLAAFEKSAGPRDGWQLSDRQQWDQLNRIVLGLRNQRATMVGAYNGHAAMANRSIFLAGLPASIQ